jgi:hypothetical protein
VAIDAARELERGGKILLDFLSYCVMAYRMEPVFVFLAREYRFRPTPAGALALYDAFLAPGADARLTSAAAHLPPGDLRLERELRPFRWADPDSRLAFPAAPVPRHLFDALVGWILAGEDNPVLRSGLDFDPALTPEANLPGGRMSAGQRAFVEGVWQPRLRRQLVAAGFWKIGNVA